MKWIKLTFWRRQAQVMHAGQLLLICIGLLWLGDWPSLHAQASSSPVRVVRAVYPSEWGVPKRAGLTYSANLNQFFLVKQGPPGDVAAGGSTIVALTPYEKLVDTVQLDFSVDNAANAAFDDDNNRLLLLNSQPAELVQIKVGSQGKLDPTTLTRFDLTGFGLQSADGIDLDRQSHQLFILDHKAQQVVQVTLTAAGPDNTTLARVDLAGLGFAKLRGLALNPANQHLYTISKEQNQLVEFTQAGQLVTTYDLTAMQLVAPRELVFAPSPDLTDAEDTIHLFIVDSKQADDQLANANTAQPSWLEAASTWLYLPLITQSTPDETANSAAQKVRYGAIVEVAFDQPSNQVSAASTNVVTEQLVRTINTAAFSKPSPDPSGMTYLPNSNTILMTDGEVDETVNGITFFAGANVWEMTLSGSVVRTTNIDKRTQIVIPITNEPTGVAWNPNNGHYYVTDDDNQEVYDVNPGADKLFGTTDDTFTSFDTASHSNMDPEGITYDPVNNHIYVSDGENIEIYEYTTSGTLVTHFDVAVYGVVDPESVEFNPVNGTLFVLSNVGNKIIVETTTSGALLNTYNVAATNALAPAGLAYAPASDGSGAMRFYIADRGVDNNDNPNENDGKIYEVTAPSAGGSTATPTSAAPTNTPTNTSAAPTNTPTNTSAAPTNTPTNTPTASGNTTALEVRVAASSDDAEESASGSMSLTSSDLELVYDGSNQTVGMRFNGISIPRGATIVNAYIQFQVDEVQSEVTALTIQGQAADNAATFTSSSRNISSRSRTAASAPWSPVAWTTVGVNGPDQRTPNLAAIIQELVNRSAWASGNSLAIIITGTGHRTARAYDGVPAAAPLLHIDYSTAAGPTATNTATPIPPTATNTSIPATATNTPVNTNTPTPVPATATNTPVNTDTPTSISPTATNTPVNTNTPTPVVTALNFSPNADARVEDNHTTTNYGNSPALRARSSGPAYRSYLKFVITGVSTPVQSAKLRLYVIDASTTGGSIYPVSNNYLNTTTPWTETGLTWQNAPAISGAPLSTLGAVALNTWVEYDVTAAIQGNGTYNFAISSTATNAVYFNSKEATANRPVLVVTLANGVASANAGQVTNASPGSAQEANQDKRTYLPLVVR